ncbi:uncharacterized protein LOC132748709 [Ruditapes philippinarum]|uniref:uncharacterized protein LOC132748709 n=1 Tax=Ruditapes philippinarum TaxID=129788 RepID=UPI00295AE706|nr:uncharacterized protein LOC132748709 [Ruditapes philippinarum]
MKTVLSIFIILGLNGVSLAIPALGHGALAGYCDTSDQCDVGECCRSFNQPRGKRVVLDHIDYNLMRYAHGSCQKMGTQGERCIVDELKTGTVGLHYDCPCASGFVCNGTGTTVINKGESGVCVSAKIAKATLNQPCSSGADCADSECCVSNVRPIGKRSLHGHCSSMGTVGSGCLVKMGSGKPSDTVFSCPCLSGLTCHGIGMYEVPLGEIGKCVI